ncbi:DinB family protein [Yeosuana sp.]|uniref:DinB family protein n=1 Tax=Yeosuana sp. TaxID=2529388 RepID=UPI004054A844
MLLKTLTKLFVRDLNKLKVEIELYNNEKNLWVLDKTILNSAGNLCLHLVGNLNHYIGSVLGKTDYMRQRDLEFSLKDIPRKELIKMVDDTIIMVEKTLKKVSNEELDKDYPLIVFKETMTTEYFLVHLATHLAYHLGQINYHRRLLD